MDNSTSKFAVGGIRALFIGGGGGGDAPSFGGKAFSENEYPLTINGAGFKLDQFSNTIQTVSLDTGKPTNLKFLIYDSSGPASIQHLALYINLRGTTRDIANSDTYIIYDKGAAPQIIDPHGYFGTVNLTPTQQGNKLELSLDMTFAKLMEKSDIIIRLWDKDKNSVDVKILDAIQVVGPLTQTKLQLPSWIKNNANWWATGQIGDSDFVKGIQNLIEQGVLKIPETKPSAAATQEIPSWIKNNAGWWADDKISDGEFVSAIQWLVSNGIIKV